MNKKVAIIVSCVILAVVGLGVYGYLTKEDKMTSLNVMEKRWIDDNKKQMLDISIFSDIPVLNYHGEGVVFDFLTDLETTTGLEFNKISYTTGSDVKTPYAFKQVDEVGDKDILIYQDNYILVTNDGKVYNSPSEIKKVTIGVLNKDLEKVNNYLLSADVTYKTYDKIEDMFTDLSTGDTINAIAVPKLQCLETVLKNNKYTIGYNITEAKVNYVLSLNGDNNTLNSIFTKYYKKWSTENSSTLFNKYLVNDYFLFQGEESQNVAKFRSKRYTYGFVNNKPFDILLDGQLIGINNSIIANFTKTSGVVVEYKQYKNYEDLVNAFNSNEIDFYLDTNLKKDFKIDVYNTVSTFEENIDVLTNDNSIVINTVNSLQPYTVSVVKDSKIAEYLSSYNINIKEYDNIDKLMKDKKAKIIAIDSYNYQYYVKKGLNNYNLAFEGNIKDEYNYKVRDISDNKQFEQFLNFYITFISTKKLANMGMNNILNTSMTEVVIKNVFIGLITLLVILFIYVIIKKFRGSKKTRHFNLSKGDKLKYIDMLTSLKNRNYLNDNIEVWDESEVYPQTIIVIDLNNVAYINDNYGHAEGDLVIKEAANILIKNQLANSEIIRTNGNEFLIYLVSYDEKQVVSYMRKLNKEFKELAHGFGAAMGYSIINDAIKTIDDAVNEATIDMKNNKEESN